jgi:hypothetical protein
MATGSVTAQASPNGGEITAPLPVTIVASSDGDELNVLAEDLSVLGVVVARDHAGVAAVLDSGLLLDCTMQGTTVTMTRTAAGQLSFV